MADSYTPSLNLRKPEVGAAHDTWGGLAGLNGDLDLIDAVFLATGLGTSVGLHVGTGKILNVEGQLQVADSTDTTKRVTFSAGAVPTASTINLAAPAVGGTIATVEVVTAVATAAHPVGTILSGYYGPTPPSGYVFVDGRTIGSPTSGATRANADCQRLFTHLWGITAQAQCPVLTSAGAASTRGANAAADWTANKRFTLPNHSGRTPAGRDNLSGTAAGVLSGFTSVGVAGGAQTETTTLSGSGSASGSLTGGASVNGSTTVSVSDTGTVVGGGAVTVTGPGHYHNISFDAPVTVSGSLAVSVSGSTAAANNIQPTIAVDVIIAL